MGDIEVRVEFDRLVGTGDGLFEFSPGVVDIREDDVRAEAGRIQFERLARKGLASFEKPGIPIPEEYVLDHEGIPQCCNRRSVGRIQLHRPLVMPPGLGAVVAPESLEMRHPHEEGVVRAKVIGLRVDRALELGIADFDLECGHDLLRDFGLQIEDVGQLAIVLLAPEVKSAGGVDQLGRDPNAPPGFANAALEHVANAQLAAHILNLDRLPLV